MVKEDTASAKTVEKSLIVALWNTKVWVSSEGEMRKIIRRKILVFICKHITLCRFFQKFEWFNQATYKEARDIVDGK